MKQETRRNSSPFSFCFRPRLCARNVYNNKYDKQTKIQTDMKRDVTGRYVDRRDRNTARTDDRRGGGLIFIFHGTEIRGYSQKTRAIAPNAQVV